MTIAFSKIGQVIVTDNGATTATTASGDTTGCTGLIAACVQKSGTLPVSVSDNKSNTWTRAGSSVASGAGTPGTLEVFYCKAPSSVGTGHTVTFTNTSGNSRWTGVLLGCTGSDQASFFDSWDSGNVSSGSPPFLSNTVSPSSLAAGAVLLKLCTTDAGTETSWSENNSGTIEVSSIFGSGFPHSAQAAISGQVVTSGAPFKASFSDGSTGTSNFAAAVFAFLGAVLGITPSQGALAFTGYAPGVVNTAARNITPDPGGAAFAGTSSVLSDGSYPSQGNVAFTGQAPTVTLISGRTITPTNAVLSFAGASALQGWTDLLGVGSGAWQGYAPLISINGPGSQTITPQQADMAFVGYAPAQILTIPAVPNGILSFQGAAPILINGLGAVPAEADMAFVGYAPVLQLPTVVGSLSWQGQISPLVQTIGPAAPSNLALTGQAPIVTQQFTLTPGVGSLSFTGLGVTNATLPNSGTLSWAGQAPVVLQGVMGSAGAVSFQGYAPLIAQTSPVLAGTPGTVSFQGYAPTRFVSTPIQHYMQRFPVGTDGTVACVDQSRAVAPFVFWNGIKVDVFGRMIIAMDGPGVARDDGLQMSANEYLCVTENPVLPTTWTDGLQVDARGFLIVTESPTPPVLTLQGLQFDVNGYVVVTIR